LIEPIGTRVRSNSYLLSERKASIRPSTFIPLHWILFLTRIQSHAPLPTPCNSGYGTVHTAPADPSRPPPPSRRRGGNSLCFKSCGALNSLLEPWHVAANGPLVSPFGGSGGQAVGHQCSSGRVYWEADPEADRIGSRDMCSTAAQLDPKHHPPS